MCGIKTGFRIAMVEPREALFFHRPYPRPLLPPSHPSAVPRIGSVISSKKVPTRPQFVITHSNHAPYWIVGGLERLKEYLCHSHSTKKTLLPPTNSKAATNST